MKRGRLKKFDIYTNPDRCTSCIRCQLACSYLHTGAFNPAAARILISITDSDRSITFTEECTGCGVCADECLFGALEKRARGKAS